MHSLFWTFFRIGIFTLGGGYAMIPMIEREVVDRHRWLGREELLDIIAVSQSCPGVFAINVSTFVGYKLRTNRGAVVAALGTALPSFIIILALAMFFRTYQDQPLIAAIFKGIRPAVVALIAVPTVKMARAANVGWANCWVPALAAIAIWALAVSPIYIIVLAAACGVARLFVKR